MATEFCPIHIDLSGLIQTAISHAVAEVNRNSPQAYLFALLLIWNSCSRTSPLFWLTGSKAHRWI